MIAAVWVTMRGAQPDEGCDPADFEIKMAMSWQLGAARRVWRIRMTGAKDGSPSDSDGVDSERPDRGRFCLRQSEHVSSEIIWTF